MRERTVGLRKQGGRTEQQRQATEQLLSLASEAVFVEVERRGQSLHRVADLGGSAG